MKKILILLSILYFLASGLVFAQSKEDYGDYSDFDNSGYIPQQVHSPGETSISSQGNYTGPQAQDESAFFTNSGPRAQDESAFFETPRAQDESAFFENSPGIQQSQGQGQNYTTGCGPQGNGYKLCIPILGVDYIENSLAGYIILIYRFALGFSGLLVFIMIVWGGIQYTVSAGNTGAISDARDRIFQAILGMLLLFLSYIILNTINPDLVSLREPNVNSVLLPNTPSVQYDTPEELALRNERVNNLIKNGETIEEIKRQQEILANETDPSRQEEIRQNISVLERQKLEQQLPTLENSIKDIDITIRQIEDRKANSHWWTLGGSKFNSTDEKQLQSYYKQRQYFVDQQNIINTKLGK